MPEINVGAQIFDVVFHPTFATVYTGLLTGHIKAFAYNEQGGHEQTFSIRPSKRSCRGLTLDQDGTHLYSVGKSKAFNIIDTTTQDVEIRAKAHDSPINRVKFLMPWLLSTGDDDGVVKLWDPRQKDSVRTYTQHFDFITDFLWLEDKKQLVATSGDGTLSVMDVRSKKPEPVAHSEDQEDELLSIVAIKGGSKVVVGTQLGILSIFNRSSGWGDCVDRIPGHPLSVDALCNIPSEVPNVDTTSIVLTGSSDGYVRAVEILPTKLLGVVADHGEWPVERIAVGGGVGQLTIEDTTTKKGSKVGKARNEDLEVDEEEKASRQRKWWVGSVGHEDVLRMSDLEGFFRDGGEDEGDEQQGSLGVHDQRNDSEDIESVAENDSEEMRDAVVKESQPAVKEAESDDDSDTPKTTKRKRKPEKEPVVPKKKGKKVVEIDKTFFDDL